MHGDCLISTRLQIEETTGAGGDSTERAGRDKHSTCTYPGGGRPDLDVRAVEPGAQLGARAPLHVAEQDQAEALGAEEAEHEGPDVAVERAQRGDDVVGAEDAHEGGRVPDLEGALLLLQHARAELRVQGHDQVVADEARPEDGPVPAEDAPCTRDRWPRPGRLLSRFIKDDAMK